MEWELGYNWYRESKHHTCQFCRNRLWECSPCPDKNIQLDIAMIRCRNCTRKAGIPYGHREEAGEGS